MPGTLVLSNTLKSYLAEGNKHSGSPLEPWSSDPKGCVEFWAFWSNQTTVTAQKNAIQRNAYTRKAGLTPSELNTLSQVIEESFKLFLQLEAMPSEGKPSKNTELDNLISSNIDYNNNGPIPKKIDPGLKELIKKTGTVEAIQQRLIQAIIQQNSDRVKKIITFMISLYDESRPKTKAGQDSQPTALELFLVETFLALAPSNQQEPSNVATQIIRSNESSEHQLLLTSDQTFQNHQAFFAKTIIKTVTEHTKPTQISDALLIEIKAINEKVTPSSKKTSAPTALSKVISSVTGTHNKQKVNYDAENLSTKVTKQDPPPPKTITNSLLKPTELSSQAAQRKAIDELKRRQEEAKQEENAGIPFTQLIEMAFSSVYLNDNKNPGLSRLLALIEKEKEIYRGQQALDAKNNKRTPLTFKKTPEPNFLLEAWRKLLAEAENEPDNTDLQAAVKLMQTEIDEVVQSGIRNPDDIVMVRTKSKESLGVFAKNLQNSGLTFSDLWAYHYALDVEYCRIASLAQGAASTSTITEESLNLFIGSLGDSKKADEQLDNITTALQIISSRSKIAFENGTDAPQNQRNQSDKRSRYEYYKNKLSKYEHDLIRYISTPKGSDDVKNYQPFIEDVELIDIKKNQSSITSVLQLPISETPEQTTRNKTRKIASLSLSAEDRNVLNGMETKRKSWMRVTGGVHQGTLIIRDGASFFLVDTQAKLGEGQFGQVYLTYKIKQVGQQLQLVTGENGKAYTAKFETTDYTDTRIKSALKAEKTQSRIVHGPIHAPAPNQHNTENEQPKLVACSISQLEEGESPLPKSQVVTTASLNQKLANLTAISSNLECLHSQKMASFDLKEGNILGTSIIDMSGLSKTADKTIITPQYAAPEAIEKEDRSSTQSDIFSLAAVTLGIFGFNVSEELGDNKNRSDAWKRYNTAKKSLGTLIQRSQLASIRSIHAREQNMLTQIEESRNPVLRTTRIRLQKQKVAALKDKLDDIESTIRDSEEQKEFDAAYQNLIKSTYTQTPKLLENSGLPEQMRQLMVSFVTRMQAYEPKDRPNAAACTKFFATFANLITSLSLFEGDLFANADIDITATLANQFHDELNNIPEELLNNQYAQLSDTEEDEDGLKITALKNYYFGNDVSPEQLRARIDKNWHLLSAKQLEILTAYLQYCELQSLANNSGEVFAYTMHTRDKALAEITLDTLQNQADLLQNEVDHYKRLANSLTVPEQSEDKKTTQENLDKKRAELETTKASIPAINEYKRIKNSSTKETFLTSENRNSIFKQTTCTAQQTAAQDTYVAERIAEPEPAAPKLALSAAPSKLLNSEHTNTEGIENLINIAKYNPATGTYDVVLMQQAQSPYEVASPGSDKTGDYEVRTPGSPGEYEVKTPGSADCQEGENNDSRPTMPGKKLNFNLS